MSWQDRQAQTYPDDTNVKSRMLQMPVASPPRPRPRKRRPVVPDCAACTDKPCRRHGYDVRASIGVPPAEPRSPDEYVKWEPVR